MSLARVIEAAEADGCELTALLDPDGSIYVHWLARRIGCPKGAGTRAMIRLCKFADKRGLTITLDCEGDRLMRYYLQFGFKVESVHEYPTQGLVPDFAMSRKPAR